MNLCLCVHMCECTNVHVRMFEFCAYECVCVFSTADFITEYLDTYK